jgi:poly(A) polymerase
VRFASRFDFTIEPATTAAIRAHAHQLPRISPERIADELRRMLMAPTRAVAWRLLWDLGLLRQLFRTMSASGEGEADRSRSIVLSLPPRESAVSFGLALAAATLDYRWQLAGRPVEVRGWLTKAEIGNAVRAMRQALKISNEESEELEGTLSGAAAMLAEPPAGVAGMKRFLATPTAASARQLLAALAEVGLLVERVARVQRELAELERTEFAPAPLITGDDLTAAGATPGPLFKRALDAVYDAQLEGRVSGRAEALEMGLLIGRGGETNR